MWSSLSAKGHGKERPRLEARRRNLNRGGVLL